MLKQHTYIVSFIGRPACSYNSIQKQTVTSKASCARRAVKDLYNDFEAISRIHVKLIK